MNTKDPGKQNPCVAAFWKELTDRISVGAAIWPLLRDHSSDVNEALLVALSALERRLEDAAIRSGVHAGLRTAAEIRKEMSDA